MKKVIFTCLSLLLTVLPCYSRYISVEDVVEAANISSYGVNIYYGTTTDQITPVGSVNATLAQILQSSAEKLVVFVDEEPEKGWEHNCSYYYAATIDINGQVPYYKVSGRVPLDYDLTDYEISVSCDVIIANVPQSSQAVSAAKAEDVVRIIQLQESGTLEAMLGESPDEIDSIVVSGPMNTQDWESLRQCCLYGRVRGIDMSEVIAENDSMPNGALAHLSSRGILKNIRLPKTLRVMGPRALKWCTSLEHVELPENLKGIGYEAFYNCISLRHIDLPATLETIGNAAFYFGRLEEVTIPEGLINMGAEAFTGNLNLKVVRIPARIQNPGWATFRGCWTLEQASLSPDTEVIPALMFQDCEAMTTFEWPSGLKEIGSNAFESCLIKRIILPDGVRTIHREAFRHNNSLIVLGLPATLEYFDETALMGCERQLKAVNCMALVPPATGDYPYYREEIRTSVAKATLYVPVGCKEAYSNAPFWRSFANIEEYDYSEYPTSITEQSLDMKQNANQYGIDGRIKATPSGIYIQNGKKYLK